ncbi:SsrA-binding protein SmpB [Patescibacteria group bacterium]
MKQKYTYVVPQLANNRKAKAQFKILEIYEAGIALTGAEVKSAKLGDIDLKGAYISIDNEQAWLKQSRIAPYRFAKGRQVDYQADRDRRLLLNKSEIKTLIGKTKTPGLTMIPITVYTKGGLVKIEVALVTGKKKRDRREEIKKRDTDRKIRRVLRQKT